LAGIVKKGIFLDNYIDGGREIESGKRPTFSNRKKRKKLTELELERLLADVAHYYAMGYSILEISDLMHHSQGTIKKWIEEVKQRWLREQVKSYEVRQAEHLSKLDKLERELWDSWDKSKAGIKRKIKTKGNISGGRNAGDSSSTTTDVTTQPGDPRYADQLLKVLQTKQKILGLDAPTVIKHTGEVGLMNLSMVEREKLTDEEKMERMYIFLERMANQEKKLPAASGEVIDGEMLDESVKVYSEQNEGNNLQRTAQHVTDTKS
jgi:hypothetical protein